MKLLTLMMVNFQGIKKMEFKPDGKSASIYGDNATGKTTIFNAMTWLLFDKPSTSAKNFTPQTKGPKGDLHYLDHSAEGIFSVEDGRIINLKKVYHENYKKKRGSTSEEFSGHSVDFYVDGVPVKEKEYTDIILGFCEDKERMKMLTMPDYFPEEMAWDERRKILLELCGDVEEDDVIKGEKELKDLKKYLIIPGTKDQYYTVDEFKKIAASKKADISRELEAIPNRIDEAQKASPDLTGISLPVIEKNIKTFDKSREELETEKAQVLSGDNISASIRKQISEANAELAEARSRHAINESKVNEGTYAAINDINKQKIAAKNRLADIENEVLNLDRTATSLTRSRAEFLEEYKKIKDEIWDTGNELCPTCKQTLPSNQVDKLRDAFNIRKSQRLERINARGKAEASKDMIDAKYDKIKTLESQDIPKRQEVKDLEEQIATLQKNVQEPQPFHMTDECQSINKRIEGYRAEATNKEGKLESLTTVLRDKINTIRTRIQAQEELKGRVNIAKAQEKRVAELSAREKELSSQYEFTERGIFLCELFVKTKVSLLNDRINSKFKCVRFRLFIEQLNGGIKEDCEVMIPSEGGQMVPFVFANNSARINAGLEIIATLSSHWNMAIPVFVDNAEAVTSLIKIDTQLIRLVVSEPDKKLRTEIDSEVKKETATKSRKRRRA